MLNPSRDPLLLNLGLVHGGIVTASSYQVAGMSDDKVRWLTRSGRWQRIYPRVFATFSGPLPHASRLWAACLYAGLDSALSHETAGSLHGICARPGLIHVTVHYERGVFDQPGLKVHRSRTFSATLIDRMQPPRTTIERTVLDLLRTQRTADAALGLVGEAVRTRRTTAAHLRKALEAAEGTRWRRAVLDALPTISAGAESPLELRDAELRRRHGLPGGTRQVRRLTDGVEVLDVVIEEFSVHIELDGRLGHDRTRERWRDMRRDNRSEVARLRHLRYGWADIVDRSCEVAIEQALVLRQQGWAGSFSRCPSCPRALPAEL